MQRNIKGISASELTTFELVLNYLEAGHNESLLELRARIHSAKDHEEANINYSILSACLYTYEKLKSPESSLKKYSILGGLAGSGAGVANAVFQASYGSSMSLALLAANVAKSGLLGAGAGLLCDVLSSGNKNDLLIRIGELRGLNHLASEKLKSFAVEITSKEEPSPLRNRMV